jgi:hypothetical protein
MKMNQFAVLLALAALLLAGGLAAAGTPFEISWWTVDAGGGTSEDAQYALSGTLGQPDAGGALSSGPFTVSGGFWAAPPPEPSYEIFLPQAVVR